MTTTIEQPPGESPTPPHAFAAIKTPLPAPVTPRSDSSARLAAAAQTLRETMLEASARARLRCADLSARLSVLECRAGLPASLRSDR